MYYFIYDDEKAYLSFDFENGNLIGVVKSRLESISISLIYKNSYSINKKRKHTDSLFNLLKSNLQKQIRRGESEAVSTCEIMLETNDFETLRRLSIIMAEDVTISKETGIINWLMMASSKGFTLKASHISKILSTVYGLTKYPRAVRPLTYNYESKLTISEVMNSIHLEKEFLSACLVRTMYGGLKGDIPMFFKVCDYYLKNSIPLENIAQKYPKTSFKILPFAIDFHVYPGLVELISQECKIDKEIVKNSIWNDSSKINYRLPSEDISETWKKIEDSFYKHGKNYLNYLMKK